MNFVENCRSIYGAEKRKLAIAAIAVVASFTFYHAIFGDNGLMIYEKKKAEYRRIQQENQQLQLENESLQKDINALKSDSKAIEREAREQLHMTRPGEMIYVVPTAQRPAQAAPPASASAQKH